MHLSSLTDYILVGKFHPVVQRTCSLKFLLFPTFLMHLPSLTNYILESKFHLVV